MLVTNWTILQKTYVHVTASAIHTAHIPNFTFSFLFSFYLHMHSLLKLNISQVCGVNRNAFKGLNGVKIVSQILCRQWKKQNKKYHPQVTCGWACWKPLRHVINAVIHVLYSLKFLFRRSLWCKEWMRAVGIWISDSHNGLLIFKLSPVYGCGIHHGTRHISRSNSWGVNSGMNILDINSGLTFLWLKTSRISDVDILMVIKFWLVLTFIFHKGLFSLLIFAWTNQCSQWSTCTPMYMYRVLKRWKFSTWTEYWTGLNSEYF